MKQNNQDELQVEAVVRKRPKPHPYIKHLKSGVTKLVYEVTQKEMDAVVNRMIEHHSVVPTNGE